ncbi:HNH/ENDO VII family nuclease, partial [Thalassolituus marinus]
RIQSALFNIIAGERAEAAMHERMLSQESAVTKVAIYTGAFMTGIGSSAWGLALWAKEVSDVVNPVVRIHNNIKAIRAAWDSENFAEAYSSNILSAEKRELVEALGFDPTAINAQQIDEAIAMSDLVMSDESLREMLYRFVKDYAEAQHSIEIAEVAGSGAFEIILTIILAAVTGGVGVLAMVGSKAALVRKFSAVGDLLSEFAQASKKIALRNSKRSAKQEKASFKDLETTETTAKKGSSGPKTSDAVETPKPSMSGRRPAEPEAPVLNEDGSLTEYGQWYYKRPSGFRKGVRNETWESAKDSEGNVYDRVSNELMDANEPWDMGHKEAYEFRKHQMSAAERGIGRSQFLDEHNTASHYTPELPSSNRSHAGEAMDDTYFGF